MESKFQNLNKDAGDIGKSKKTSDAKKSVMFSVGQTEVSVFGKNIDCWCMQITKIRPFKSIVCSIILFFHRILRLRIRKIMDKEVRMKMGSRNSARERGNVINHDMQKCLIQSE